MVRIAVATFESVFLMPDFANIAVIPAKNAESTAAVIHILPPPFNIVAQG